MLEFKTIEELKLYTKLLELIKNHIYKIKKEKLKLLYKFIEPTEYLTTYPIILTIYFYVDWIINYPNVEDNNIIGTLILISKTKNNKY